MYDSRKSSDNTSKDAGIQSPNNQTRLQSIRDTFEYQLTRYKDNIIKLLGITDKLEESIPTETEDKKSKEPYNQPGILRDIDDLNSTFTSYNTHLDVLISKLSQLV